MNLFFMQRNCRADLNTYEWCIIIYLAVRVPTHKDCTKAILTS